MKILQVIPNLKAGGAEHFTSELTLELCRMGHKCDVLTLFDDTEENDLKFILQKHTTVISLNKKRGFDIKCLFKLYNFVKNGNYEVVHAHVNAIPYLLMASLLIRKVRFIATIHSDARFEAGKSINKWIRVFLFKCHLCLPVTISNESFKSFEQFYNIKAPIIFNGISEYSSATKKTIRDNSEQTLFIHPASCQEVKNQRLLFRAFSKLVKDYPNVKMIWIGNNSTFSDLFKDLQNEMVEQIHYLGVVPNVRDYLCQADAMCLSSKIEGMPMTIIESFSVSCPSICTPVGGIKNMIKHNVNGILSKDLSVESYYEALMLFMKQTPDQRSEMRNEAKNSFFKYNISNCANEYLKIYKIESK